jgi:hypothetical protein
VSTKIFHAHTNSHQRKKYVWSLLVDSDVVVVEERKAEVAFCYFNEVLGSSLTHSNAINLDLLSLPHLDPLAMGERFTEAEVWAVIKVRHHATLDAFWSLHTRDLRATNDALLVLLPKSSKASTIRDYRPISLIHLIGMLISKILANRLAPRLSSLVPSSQSAFIKGRSIHGSFLFVEASVRQLFIRNKPTILFKADISKTFDSVAWSFLLEFLGHLGFSNVWINWIVVLLRRKSTKILLNGVQGASIRHGRGLR